MKLLQKKVTKKELKRRLKTTTCYSQKEIRDIVKQASCIREECMPNGSRIIAFNLPLYERKNF